MKCIAIILAVIMILSFSACSKNNESEAMPNPAATYCQDILEGEYTIMEGEGGVCKLPDGSIIEHTVLTDLTLEWMKDQP